MATIQFTDSNGNVQTLQMLAGSSVTITNVAVNETIDVNASAIPATGQPPHVESVRFIGPSQAGQPIKKRC